MELLKVYYSILFFICLAVKPLYTIGYIGYYELHIDYIVEKYCVNKNKPKFKCNGKCHLSKKIALSAPASTSNTTNKSISNSISEAFVPVFFHTINFNIQGMEVLNKGEINKYIYSKTYSSYIPIVLPPPQSMV